MTVYLICLDTEMVAQSGHKRKRARHYLGMTLKEDAGSVEKRLATHRRGEGAKFLWEANQRGITYAVVRVWDQGDPEREPGETDSKLERRLKRRGHHASMCPRCREEHLAKRREYMRRRRREARELESPPAEESVEDSYFDAIPF